MKKIRNLLGVTMIVALGTAGLGLAPGSAVDGSGPDPGSSSGAPLQSYANGSAEDSVVLSKQMRDETTGAPLGPDVVQAWYLIKGTTVTALYQTVSAMAASTRGRATFTTTLQHRDGCLFGHCAYDFKHVQKIDASWYAPWGSVKQHYTYKYVPVDADGFYRYLGQSSAYGFDNNHYYRWAGYPFSNFSGLYYRSTANIDFCPSFGAGVGCAPLQTRIIQRIHSNGTWNWRTNSQ